MKSNFTNCLRIAALSLAATSAVAQEAEFPVAVNTEGLPDHVRARIEDKAQNGITELRRYLDSTKHIRVLRVELVVKQGDTQALATASEDNLNIAQQAE